MVMTTGQGGAMKEKITAGLKDVIIRSVELLRDAERRYYQAEMMPKFLLVVVFSGAGIRPGESDNREEFGGIENRDRLKGLILYLRQPAHGRQESAVEGQYHGLDRTGQTSRSKHQNHIPLYLDHCGKTARHVDLRKKLAERRRAMRQHLGQYSHISYCGYKRLRH
jgi:hypothetical protein